VAAGPTHLMKYKATHVHPRAVRVRDTSDPLWRSESRGPGREGGRSLRAF
jgi:hypothetical protein